MSPNDGPAIETRGLEKTYRVGHLGRQRVRALHPLDLQVPRGEIFGYLGPNGSGKTTTLKLLLGLVFPDAGSIRVLGHPGEGGHWRRATGFLPETPYFYDYLTPSEYLDYAGRLFGMSGSRRRERAAELLELVGLTASADTPLRRFSKGMMQRMGLAQALLNDPELVILDEPMSGLDPIGRRLVRRIILGLRESGKTVLFSTHILGDAETLCDRVAVLRSGKLLKVGRLDEILDVDVSHTEVLVSGLSAEAAESLPGGVQARRQVGERLSLEVEEAALGALVRAVEQAGGRIRSVQPVRQSLEDYFFKELGREAGDSWSSD